jgi:hypothetical protein
MLGNVRHEERAKGEGMGEAPAGGGGRADLEHRIVQKSLEDDAFRRRLLADPKGTVERELGARLPEGVEVRAVEETADTVFVVLPERSAGAGADGGLSDRDLESVAGGDWGEPSTSPNSTCNCGL